ncbi:MAG: class I SAM-dependent methyltransferase, partial [Lentisphaeria bacterium]
EPINEMFFGKRIHDARLLREQLKLGIAGVDLPADSPDANLTACRIIHGEADGLPAIVIDLFGAYLICQFSSAPADYWKNTIVQALHKEFPHVRGIYERSDADARRRDGLEESGGLLWGEEPPEEYTITEYGVTLLIDLKHGHKTGYYLDQRENRQAVIPYSRDADVLDCCCYSGGFGLRALQGGAKSVVFLDAAKNALDLAKKNMELNHFPMDHAEWMQADIFLQLRKLRDMGRSFDLIILDPPKFADTHSRLIKAARGYKDINLLAAKLLRPGGHLFTFSCSAAMTPELFRKVVGDATRDAGRKALLVKSFAQSSDHPHALDFPEGYYLTGLHLILP